MNSLSRSLGLALALFLMSFGALAQSAPPTSLTGCLDADGNLYGLRPAGQLGEGCSLEDLPIRLGSTGDVKASNGLVGNLSNGVLGIGVANGLAIPPSCPPGQVAVSDDNGGWVCTPPNALARTPNIGSTVWVVPSFVLGRNPADLDDRLRIRTAVAFVNLGNDVTTIQAQAFSEEGAPVALANPIKDIPSQGRRVYLANRETAWMMAVSCNRVIATAFDRIGRQDGSGGFQIEAYPVDCAGANKEEFICRAAEAMLLINCLLPNSGNQF